eukprot:TRINITY_DN21204_c0_g1_i1.p2 TRINITY_DN21204_c0_g1~~TRINITY_DN21204_c0_g1_i1.p2  ORF type:complete len:174 (+),score=3.97 TRINITY_DN21204_c0_g1_i1:240-761(+)
MLRYRDKLYARERWCTPARNRKTFPLLVFFASFLMRLCIHFQASQQVGEVWLQGQFASASILDYFVQCILLRVSSRLIPQQFMECKLLRNGCRATYIQSNVSKLRYVPFFFRFITFVCMFISRAIRFSLDVWKVGKKVGGGHRLLCILRYVYVRMQDFLFVSVLLYVQCDGEN